MAFSINIPCRIYSGTGCVKAHGTEFALGNRAFIVTGKSSAKLCGALDDVCSVLAGIGVGFEIYSGVRENPPVTDCFEAGRICADKGCDFVIAIGGGSAMDAAKAIAAFATTEYAECTDIFDYSKKKAPSLPLICIPTTAGTGSEGNRYSVLTLPDGKRKRTFSHDDSWAKKVFLDPKYTYTLSREYTFSTALDAFHHAMESYLSPKSDDLSRMLAIYAARNIWDVLSQLPEQFSENMRASLLYASCAAGIAISVTGTGFPHPLGYSLTLLDGIPHGKACAAFAADYIEYNRKNELGETLIGEFCAALGVKVKVLGELLVGLASVDLCMTEEQIAEHVELIKSAGNYANSPYVLSVDEMYDIYRKHFAAKRKRGNC
ncbi:MAG: iron-containing alcohol dehydrogenase [Clostridia bacterium]|nr:iron-containing alcohol dehydrogenase [Clostridia bacterium]